jgi:aspartate racemase
MKTLGLIGGISWLSTIEYYRIINEQINARVGGSQFASCIIRSFNYGEIQALTAVENWDEILELFATACIHLREGGAQGIVLCANTAHLVADKLEQRVELPVIHIGEATANAVEKAGLKTVGLLGTRFTMERDFIKRRLAQHQIDVLIPDLDDREFIHSTIFGELGKGILRAETKQRYQSIISDLVSRGAQGAILGCTEIPLLITEKDISVTAFDTTFLHATAAVDFALA